MTSSFSYSIDDKDLDDAALWAVIDSAAASLSSSTKSRKPLALKYNNVTLQSPTPISTSSPSPQAKLPNKNPRNHYRCNSSPDGEVLQENSRPHKLARISCVSELSETSYGLIPSSSASPSPPLAIVKHVQRTPTTTPISYSSPVNHEEPEEGVSMMHSLFGRFPSVSLFKQYQNAAMEILEKGDYTMIFGCPYIKKSGWRKISFYFNLSYEIKDKAIEFDENRNVQRAEFVVRGHMQGGRFSDGWGSCERREKKFLKPNHDIPSTAETRAKNKACQDLLGIGEYRPGASHVPK